MKKIAWHQLGTHPSYNYKCGYCGNSIASEKAYHGLERSDTSKKVQIFVCHKCNRPTFFDFDGSQYPGAIIGNPVQHISNENVEKLFNEAKSCYSINAYTSSVMCSRKLLMNIAVSEGAKEGLSFTKYVDFLNDNNYIPPNGKVWVDSIRTLGNEANHKIRFKTPDEAKRILQFVEMLLRFIYELPGIMETTIEEEETPKGNV